MLKVYKITLQSGVERLVSREEPEGKSLIGLWIWASRQIAPIIIDFNECVVKSDEIAMVDKQVEGLDNGAVI